MFLGWALALVGLDVLLGRVEPLASGTQDPLVDDGVAVSPVGVQKIHLKSIAKFGT